MNKPRCPLVPDDNPTETPRYVGEKSRDRSAATAISNARSRSNPTVLSRLKFAIIDSLSIIGNFPKSAREPTWGSAAKYGECRRKNRNCRRTYRSCNLSTAARDRNRRHRLCAKYPAISNDVTAAPADHTAHD